jgi:hypothetical protein
VKYHIASRDRLLQGHPVAQVSYDALGLQLLNIPEVTAGSDQQPETGPLSNQRASDVAADKSRRTGEKNKHLAIGN